MGGCACGGRAPGSGRLAGGAQDRGSCRRPCYSSRQASAPGREAACARPRVCGGFTCVGMVALSTKPASATTLFATWHLRAAPLCTPTPSPHPHAPHPCRPAVCCGHVLPERAPAGGGGAVLCGAARRWLCLVRCAGQGQQLPAPGHWPPPPTPCGRRWLLWQLVLFELLQIAGMALRRCGVGCGPCCLSPGPLGMREIAPHAGVMPALCCASMRAGTTCTFSPSPTRCWRQPRCPW